MRRIKIGEPSRQDAVHVYDHNMHRVGHTGPRAGSSVAARMLGHPFVELQKVKGRPAWVATKPSKVGRVSALPLMKSLRAAKGSNS
jgi:hypothetical protein